MGADVRVGDGGRAGRSVGVGAGASGVGVGGEAGGALRRKPQQEEEEEVGSAGTTHHQPSFALGGMRGTRAGVAVGSAQLWPHMVTSDGEKGQARWPSYNVHSLSHFHLSRGLTKRLFSKTLSLESESKSL